MKIQIEKTAIRIIQGDITKVDFAEAIVNSVGSISHGNNGVSAAIHNAAGPKLKAYYIEKGGCKTGGAIITPSFNLPCKAVIHTMGPLWMGGNHQEVSSLVSCYKNSLKMAKLNKYNRIAFSSISTGHYGFPLEKAAYIAVHAISEFIYDNPGSFTDIYFVLNDEKTNSAYCEATSILAEELRIGQSANQYRVIGFYHEYDHYGCFSNWYPAEFEYVGKIFANSEQYMMYHKVMMFGRKDLAEKIMRTSDPSECKAIAGQPFPEFNPVTWESTCYTIVKRGVKAKFKQNPGLQSFLKKTGNALLVECSPIDKKWGIGLDINDSNWNNIAKWKGKNLLGRILMEVRDELRQCTATNYSSYSKGHKCIINESPINEWEATAAVLERIPKYHATIHAYADTLRTQKDRDRFYHLYSLYEWELQMKINNGDGLPEVGFYEMKQDIYDITRGV